MAVAPLNQVKKVLDYAVTAIPPEKIFMGMPNYAYDWTLPFVRGTSAAQSLGNVAAVDLARQYNTTIQYDDVSQAPYFYYTDSNEAQHVVWFDDARSILAKLTTASEYNLHGVSYWNIMKFFPQNWLVANQIFSIRKVL
ncbi:glycosyl hydrolase family 18 protein [Anaeromicropila populeti]|uniref:Glycosyl hydrolases family 18 n=1 Tax=Anaeromicropila populeti TaxID=37658 RepID=A0A1I6KLZ9_9FIRM|nr:glycosyl hydrolase family 18 protein [Anaeromicropila populeti]SFR92226.1 Glycosyl hydrolases family 18 [Anaeromicropila populeti]